VVNSGGKKCRSGGSRFGILLSWELSEHMKLITFVVSFFVLSLVLTVKLLSLHTVGFGRGGSAPAISGTLGHPNHHIVVFGYTNPILQLPGFAWGFWVLLAFVIPFLTILTFRYPRDYGYAQAIQTLPVGKGALFGAKLLSLYIFSVFLTFVSLVVVQAVCYSDLPGFLKEVFESPQYLRSVLTAMYFINYVVSISIFSSILFRNSFITFVVSFFVITVPYFAGMIATLPPFMFLAGHPPLPFSPKYLTLGLGLPVLLLMLSWLLFTRRDVV